MRLLSVRAGGGRRRAVAAGGGDGVGGALRRPPMPRAAPPAAIDDSSNSSVVRLSGYSGQQLSGARLTAQSGQQRAPATRLWLDRCRQLCHARGQVVAAAANAAAPPIAAATGRGDSKYAKFPATARLYSSTAQIQLYGKFRRQISGPTTNLRQRRHPPPDSKSATQRIASGIPPPPQSTVCATPCQDGYAVGYGRLRRQRQRSVLRRRCCQPPTHRQLR